ncbi:MAG: hypothetical protein Ct9H300mP3_04370 [Gammaproteobacteria bacterium]|nr:MAG: hypothetical protein Ct9H300mP3_04370 [Gammaproteobacteria bacterium]
MFSFIGPMWLGLGVSTIADLVLPKNESCCRCLLYPNAQYVRNGMGPYLTGELVMFYCQGVMMGNQLRQPLLCVPVF